jgi:hypothetical protein
MPANKPAKLPAKLRYLQPFADRLAKLPPDEQNEEVDASPLDAALRKRLRGKNEAEALTILEDDRDLLEEWLSSRPDHPAHWILGYIMWPDELAEVLTSPVPPPARGPEFTFEAPAGWTMKPVPFRLDLKAGKMIGTIVAMGESMFELSQRQREFAVKNQPAHVQSMSEISDISIDTCRGKKFCIRMTAPAPSKQVDYVLRVPGGCVSITLSTLTGDDFDESPLEAKLHTLSLSPPRLT